MDERLNGYLEKVDKYLRPIPASERVDIVKEIKSQMQEMEASGVPSEKIIERLGDPKALAKAYLGEAIANSKSFSWKRFRTVVGFYSYAGIGGIFILPVISILAVGFMISGVICPIVGVIKLVGFSMGFDIPQIGINIGTYSFEAVPAFFISVLLGAILFFLGWGFWRLTILFIKSVSKQKRSLSSD